MSSKKYGKMKVVIIFLFASLLVVAAAGSAILLWQKTIQVRETPGEMLERYVACIEKGKYAAMYEMIHPQSSACTNQKEFVDRNSNIYGGIEIKDVKVENIREEKGERQTAIVSYTMSFETSAGQVKFDNDAVFVDTDNGYRIQWDDHLIFPRLTKVDKVRVSEEQARRGEIKDRNGKMLAGEGTASSIGIVPGKLKDRGSSLQKLAQLLELDLETVENKLSAGWVKEDSFVPLAVRPKVQELDLLKEKPDEKLLQEQQRQQQILAIPGVMLTDTKVRMYGLGEAASHLIGYVQEVTAEDLEKHSGEGYRAGSVIGRSGIEGLFEKELKGQDGCRITIVDETGQVKETIASSAREDGKDIQLTIDAELQADLYGQMKEVPGCSVAIQPYTGETLALVSTPGYDSNDFVQGMSQEKWDSLNTDVKKPLYNRFRQNWCPGSTFKPVIAAIGLKNNAFDPAEDFGNEGLSWQKDSSWGSYYVTTLQAYEPVIMKNAIIYSDNIYFAKAALRIGSERFMKSLDELGFNQKLPFEITMSDSQYSNTERIETEIQLADSGYGQGQILVNPLHLASMYTAFLNGGNMVKPYIQYKEEAIGTVWKEQMFSEDIINQVMEGMTGVVNDPRGTAYRAHRDDRILAGKTGTAEIKAAKEDVNGTEIGWFSVFTAEKDTPQPILLISMVENVKEIGGSGYVVNGDKEVLDRYFK